MYIHINAITGAKRESLRRLSEHSIEIKVKERAIKNQANQRIRTLVAEHFDVELQCVKIARGHRGTHKLIGVTS